MFKILKNIKLSFVYIYPITLLLMGTYLISNSIIRTNFLGDIFYDNNIEELKEFEVSYKNNFANFDIKNSLSDEPEKYFFHSLPEDLHLRMPVIFDEVGKLDAHNLKEVLKAMQENGLTLFAANPAPTGTIVNVLEVSHDLSIFKATDVDVHHKAEAIYFPGMEERLAVIPDVAIKAEL